jgi:hypothetical protein
MVEIDHNSFFNLNKKVIMILEVKNCSLEYCASIVKIGKLEKVENSDNLVRTFIDGYPILVNKNEVSEGDVMVYSPIETEINSDFLRTNNLYSWKDKELNHNYPEICMLLSEDYKYEDLKHKVGYFMSNGRVKIVRLLQQPSCGVLFSLDYIERWLTFHPNYHELKESDKEQLRNSVGTKFNYVEGLKFCDVYIPKQKTSAKTKKNKERKALKKIDRLVPGQFYFHYDTDQLGSNTDKLSPDTEVDISIKIHGTSVIIGNLKVLKPKFKTGINFIDRFLFKHMPKSLMFNEGYDIIYSSRKVIKNDDLNPGRNNFYETNVWKEYADLLGKFIPEDLTVYGEIFGYETGTTKFIQKDYDYGCKEGTNKMMIYRITQHTDNGLVEWDIERIMRWVIGLKNINSTLNDKIQYLPLIFTGKLSEIVSCKKDENWAVNLVKELKDNFNIESREPFCKNDVPREGIVIRIKNDPVAEAFKLKGTKFFYRESKQIDEGEIDMELKESMENGEI